MVKANKTLKTPRAYADRKAAHARGLRDLKAAADELRELHGERGGVAGRIAPRLYDEAGMPEVDQIIEGDCVSTLNDGPEGWVDLVFADPPFNIGYLYDGYEDLKPAEQYRKWSREWIDAVYRALSPTGSFFLAIGDDYAAELCVEAKAAGFTMRNWIVWHYTFGQQPKHKFARSHTHILYFVKDPKQFTFNRDAIKVMSARQAIYNDARAAKGGKIPDDTWYLRPQDVDAETGLFDASADVWHESRVCGTFKEREGWHGCQMPIAVLERVIKTASNPGDVVLDPFNGSGTTALSAALLDRRYVGIEQNAEYVTFARNRLANALDQHGVAADGSIDRSKVVNPDKIQTETDALGRKRTKRSKVKASA